MSGYTSIVDSTPMFVPGTFDAQDVRLATVGNARAGLFASGDFAVSQRAAGANMSVDIAAGRAYVSPDAVAQQGSYLAWYGSSFNTATDGGYTWTAADPTNPRIDLLCLEVGDTDFGGSFTGWKWRIVDGTPNAGATNVDLRQYWPAEPDGVVVVAAVRVPAAATTITDANILNLDRVGGMQAYDEPGKVLGSSAGTLGGTTVSTTGDVIRTLSDIEVKAGRKYHVTGLAVLSNANSGSIRSGSVDVKHGGTSLGFTVPDIHLPFVSGAQAPVPVPYSFTWTPVSDATADLTLVASASAVATVSVFQNSLSIIAG